MSTAYISLGSNLGDRELNVNRAVELIGMRAGKMIVSSSLFETMPWGFADQPAFINSACSIETTLSPQELLLTLRAIEDELGRDRSALRWGPRVIDLDILLYNSLIIDEPNLRIPHPHMHERIFVLAPMVEIAPEAVHPVLGVCMEDILGRLG